MKWHVTKEHQEWRLDHNPFTLIIFLGTHSAECILRFGHESDGAEIIGKDAEGHLEAAQKFCINWAKQKLKELNDDFNDN